MVSSFAWRPSQTAERRIGWKTTHFHFICQHCVILLLYVLISWNICWSLSLLAHRQMLLSDCLTFRIPVLFCVSLFFILFLFSKSSLIITAAFGSLSESVFKSWNETTPPSGSHLEGFDECSSRPILGAVGSAETPINLASLENHKIDCFSFKSDVKLFTFENFKFESIYYFYFLHHHHKNFFFL